MGLLVAAAAFVAACFVGEAVLERLYPLTNVPRNAPSEAYFAALGGAPSDTDAGLTLPHRGTDPPGVKQAGSFRIVVLGESSALGVPYAKKFSFGSLLVKAMEAVRPDRRFERVHVAENGRSSQGVVHFLDTAFAADPDVLVVYSGHNEFIYRLTLASPFGKVRTFPWKWLPRIQDALDRLRDDGSIRLRREALASVPEDQREEVSMPLDVYCNGNREEVPWTNLPLEPRERELFADRYRRNLETMARRARERGVPIVFVRPTSHLQCPPLASGKRFDPEASAAFAAAEAVVASDPVKAFELYNRARDLDPAPVRMPAVHRRIFDEVMERQGLAWVDGDACAARVAGGPLTGDAVFVDFMHPRETVHAEIALALAVKFHEMGLPGVDPADAAAVDAFRDACRRWREENRGEIAHGDATGLRWFTMMYATFGNPAAAKARVLSAPVAARTLTLTLLLDLTARWSGDASLARREFEAARARHPEWSQSLDVWSRILGPAR